MIMNSTCKLENMSKKIKLLVLVIEKQTKLETCQKCIIVVFKNKIVIFIHEHS